ncbi:WD40 repeat domain-containing protein [Sediminitomix flava]|uniref:WD-40 repeat-containing protein n=1 Tax=Sediminitomix flava TaxID=379075 RepID=A0A315Z764_SEDFL|nr:hypothetical protein [Sediminitomix flava]PWJ40173.1 WD-40 repeat-containing protein [Sediminitomix flava]
MITSRDINIEKLGTFTGHKDSLYALAPSNQKGVFYCAGLDGMITKWDISKPDQGELVAKVQGTVYAMFFNPVKNELIVGQNNEGLHLIDLNENKKIKACPTGQHQIFDIKLFNGKIYLAQGDGFLSIIDYEKFSVDKKVKLSDKHSRSLAIQPDQDLIFVGSSDNIIRGISLADYNIVHELTGHEFSIFSLNFSKDYNYLLSGSRDAHLKIWNSNLDYALSQDIVAHMYTINHISYREDGRYFATCSKDKSIKIWDAESFKLLKVIDKARYAGHGTSVNKLLWLDSTTLASCSDDRSISIWKVNGLPE